MSLAPVSQTPEQWRESLIEVDYRHVSEVVGLASRAERPLDAHAYGRLRIRLDSARRAGRPWNDTEEFVRGDVLGLVNLAMTETARTGNEQRALESLCGLLDGAFKMLTAQAKETHETRLHRCGCGALSTGYWCSFTCQNEDDGPYFDDDYVTDDDDDEECE